MKPVRFAEANAVFGAPPDLDESQCMSIPAFLGPIEGGNLDGQSVAIVAWQPEPSDLQRLAAGHPVYLLCCGGLPPHCLMTEFPAKKTAVA
jgi:hypothetical protein